MFRHARRGCPRSLFRMSPARPSPSMAGSAQAEVGEFQLVYGARRPLVSGPVRKKRVDMKDTRTSTQLWLMNDQDALRARAGKLAAESAAASDATSWFELLYQAAAPAEATIPSA